MKQLLLISLCVIFLYACSPVKNVRVTHPEGAGLSSAGLARMSKVMQGYVDENKIPGLITMVSRHDKVVHFEKYGMMGTNKPMQLNTIFRIASMTKPVTSVAVMMLYEEGRFKLDDPVSKYIPEFKDLKVFPYIDKDSIHVVDALRPMTIGDLLTHTSGLGNGWGDNPVDSLYREANLSDGTLKDMILKLSKIPLLYQPGTQWNYGRSTDVLGYLVEVVSGKPFDEFLKERIFKPLKMEDTYFYLSEEKLNRVASVYATDDSAHYTIVQEPDTINTCSPVKFLSGNGGLISTAKDYMIFSQMLLNKGVYKGTRLLKSETVRIMTADHLSGEIMPEDDFFGPLMKGMGFGYGFAILNDTTLSNAAGSKGSYWWSGSGNTYFFIDPKEDLVLILMAQFVPNFRYPIFKEFRDGVYSSIIR